MQFLICLFYLAVPNWRFTNHAGTAESWHVTQNLQKNTQSNVVEVEVRRDIIVDKYQQHQGKFYAAVNIIFQLKQRDDWIANDIIIFQLKKGPNDMAIPALEGVENLSIYLLLEYMGFNTNISDGVKKMRVATLL